MSDPTPVAVLLDGCGWLIVFSDGRIRCTNPKPCTGSHHIIVAGDIGSTANKPKGGPE